MISTHLPALQVIIPLLSAPICAILRKGYPAWLLSLFVSWLSFAISVSLLGQVLTNGPISFLLGSWAAPWGIEYKVDI